MRKSIGQKAVVGVLVLALLAGTFSGCQKAKTEEGGEKWIVGRSYAVNDLITDLSTVPKAVAFCDVVFLGTAKSQTYKMYEYGAPFFYTQFQVEEFFKGGDGPEIKGKTLTLTSMDGLMPMKQIEQSVNTDGRYQFQLDRRSQEEIERGYFEFTGENVTTVEVGKKYLVFAGYKKDDFGDMRLIQAVNPYGVIEFGTDGYPVWQEQVKAGGQFRKTKDEVIAEIKAAVKEQAGK